MAWSSPNSQAPPGRPLLGHVDRDGRSLSATRVEATVLGEDVVGSDGVGLVVGHPTGPVGAT